MSLNVYADNAGESGNLNSGLTKAWPSQVNEIAWNTTGELFFLTTGNGELRFY